MIKAATLAGVILSGVLISAGQTTPEPRTFFTEQMGLSDSQIATVARGKALVKVLPSKTPAEIFVFGAVFVNGTPEEYLKLALDVGRLRRLPGYLGVGRFSDPPTLSDLEDFTLEPEDIRNLKTCRPGKCSVQLTAEAMQALQKGLDWSGPSVATQVNDRVRRMALEVLRRYQEDGNSVLGSYRDKGRLFDMDAQLQALLSRSKALPLYLPGLNRYLLDYPNTTLANVESLFYWERVNFGLKPTLRLNHAIAYRSAGPRGVAQVVAVKQLWASHYFQLALDLTVCFTESGRNSDTGFYLISLKGSKQEGLTGLKGSLLRRVVVGKTRSAQEKALLNIKKALEEKQ
ncbi:MAG TPA: hypothetical protein VKM93_19115 [Terriglobia bacterium]|nr:hypothetical protein [Terriglobia bacterium]